MANRSIRIYKKYFTEFYLEQTEAVRRKINYCLNMIKTVDRVPSSILCSMDGTEGLYEVRVEVGGNIFRIFCCFDEGTLVILFNAFQKKTQKTPKKEIEKAKRLMKEYFDEKRNG